MIELQFINKLLQEGSLTLAKQNDITEDYFNTYTEEYEFIQNHYKEYGTMPDPL